MGNGDRSRVAIVTGAGGGLGGVMAEALLAEGHQVVGMDLRRDGLEAFQARNAAAAERIALVEGDVAREADCAAAVQEAVARFGSVGIVINNAGIGPSSIRPDAENRLPDIEELTPAVWERFFAVNVHGAFHLTRAAMPHLKAAGWGRVLNNTTSFRTMLRILPYGASKAALESMAAVWSEEFRPAGITANVIVPGGPTDTAFIDDAAGWDRARMIRPQVMGPPVAWLCSEAAGDVTGQRIIAANWDPALDPRDALAKAGAPIGWPDLADSTAVWLRG